MKIAVQCGSWGDRCGISSYTDRLVRALNKQEGVEAFPFIERFREKDVDLICIQYEPGMCPPQKLQYFLNKYAEPIVVLCHHTGYIPQFYPMVDGVIFHSQNQIQGEPWSSKIIKHPALVFPEKGKEKMRKKYGLPLDKKIIGTAGFIAGTGKKLPAMAKCLLTDMKDDEFLYFITSFWKGGDFSATENLKRIVKEMGKEKQFRLDTDFVPEEVLNEKMQCCDLLFSWNNSTSKGSNSGIAPDMIGSRRKMIVKDTPHYADVASIEGVEVGRIEREDFAKDVLKLLRTGDLEKVPDPEPLSWNVLIKEYIDYFSEVIGE